MNERPQLGMPLRRSKHAVWFTLQPGIPCVRIVITWSKAPVPSSKMQSAHAAYCARARTQGACTFGSKEGGHAGAGQLRGSHCFEQGLLRRSGGRHPDDHVCAHARRRQGRLRRCRVRRLGSTLVSDWTAALRRLAGGLALYLADSSLPRSRFFVHVFSGFISFPLRVKTAIRGPAHGIPGVTGPMPTFVTRSTMVLFSSYSGFCSSGRH